MKEHNGFEQGMRLVVALEGQKEEEER